MTARQWLSFQGRIGRKTFWLSYILPLILINLATVALMDRVMWLVLWGFLVAMIKRLHDRNRSGWWFGGFLLVNILAGATIPPILGASPYADLAEISRAVPLSQDAARAIFLGGLLILAYGIYLLVEVGLLRGTAGQNRFGPDPLDSATADP